MVFLVMIIIAWSMAAKSHDLDEYMLASSGDSMVDVTFFHLDADNKYKDVFPAKIDENSGCFPRTRVYVDSGVTRRAKSQNNSFSAVLQGVSDAGDEVGHYAEQLCGNVTLTSRLRLIDGGTMVWRQADYSFIRSVKHSLTMGSSRCSPKQPVPLPPPLSSRVRVIDEAIFDSSAVWAQSYYHSTSEKFFPLALARGILEANPNISIIVETIPDQLKEQLALIGIDVSRLVVVNSSDTAVYVKRLYYPTWLYCGWTSPSIAQEMRSWIQEKNPDVYKRHMHRRKRLYDTDSSKIKLRVVVIDRRDRQNKGCNRCLANTDEVVAAIRTKYPRFEVVLFSADPSQKVQLSQKDTMKLFANTTIVVAPHGAALANFVYAPKGASMIEILNQDPMNPCFMVLARSLANDYYGITPITPQQANVSKIMDVIEMILLKEIKQL